MPNLAQPKLWTDHSELFIVKGVYIAPSDPFANEFKIDSINLLDEKSGVSLAPDGGWTPQYPSIEGSGVWADTPLMVGRTPLVMTEGNVIEKMRLNIGASSTAQMLAIKAKFSLFVRYCRDFWTEAYQIDPVFLHWFASCGSGRQYATIYNMELDWDDKDSPTPISVLTLTIEREPYWRWLPPGANPVQWRYEYYNQVYDYTKANLLTGGATNALVTGTIQNRSEFNAAYTALVSDNSITIPASVVLGDASALLYAYIAPSSSTRQNIIVGKKTTKIAQINSGGPSLIQNCILNAADGTLGTDATKANDTGASLAAGAGTAQHVEISFATASNQPRLLFSANFLNTVNRFIGRWMLFMRARQINGSSGDISMYLRYGLTNLAGDSDGVKLNVVNPILTGALGNSTNWGLHYMGVIQVPMMPAKADVDSGNAGGQKGEGLLKQAAGDMRLYLFASRSTGAGVLYINDLIFIPIDEGGFSLESADNAGGTHHQYDETGYLSHGLIDPYFINGNITSPALDKMTGTGIQLTPGVENRLYMLSYDGSNLSQVADTFDVRIYIIPRSRGIRGQGNING